ncbi:tetratricopeptide repeat protein [Muribaculaceae bacterium Isolate-013 (NCI)]|nr:tetratricopeptide repeat protein [Muribaculaceae bacterium Isolate-013 (NCI)]
MKSKFLLTLLAGAALSASAQGFKDGVEYYRADQPEEAAIIINNNLNEAGIDQASAYYFLGQIALKNGNKAKAREYFDKGLGVNPDNAYNYIGLGALALADGNTSDASRYFKDAKGKAKKDPDMLTEIARAYFVADPVKYSDEISKALADAKKAKKNAPAPFILEGDMLAGTNAGEAAGMYEMAAQFDTDQTHPEAYVKYARTYFPVNATFAINKLKDLLAQQPNSALAQRELAEKYYDNNQLTMAAEQYEQYIKNPNSFKKDKQRLVGLLFFAKRYPESYNLASEILREDPANYYMQRLQFYNKKAMGENEAAKAAAETLFANSKAELNSQDYSQYGDLLQEMGQDTLAVAAFEKAVTIDPKKTSLLKDLSAAYNTAKMYDKAAEAMQKYVDAMGDDVDPNDVFQLARRYQNLAITNMDGDQAAFDAAIAKAKATMEQVIARVPDNPLVLNTSSDIIRTGNKGEVDQAVIDADMKTLAVLDADPANKEKRANIYRAIYSRLAPYYQKQKDIPTAKLYYEKFYEVDPSPELRDFIDNQLK